VLDGSAGLTAEPIDVAVTAPVGLTGDLGLTKVVALLAWGRFSR
jgi:hypothetical protein